MASVVACCSDIQQFHEERILDADWCRRFPGSAWLPLFARLIAAQGHRLTTGDVALKEIENGTLVATDIIVIAAEDSRHAQQLLNQGAQGGIVICAESPLFARTFYERIGELGPRYSARILFQATIDAHFPKTPNTFPTQFPSFARGAPVPTAQEWSSRSALVMVASNKYWRTPFDARFIYSTKKLEAWLRGKLGLTQSPIKRLARAAQLHDHRLEVIKYFGERGILTLYGSGWNRLTELPSKWRRRLAPLLARLKPNVCDDKQATIANFRFAFAIENIRYPGYHTEKIIDCFAAGVIPIYFGDPLITQVIPSDTFIHLADFPSMLALDNHLHSFTPERASTMIAAGRKFIHAQGDDYSYESFAEKALAIIRSQLNP